MAMAKHGVSKEPPLTSHARRIAHFHRHGTHHGHGMFMSHAMWLGWGHAVARWNREFSPDSIELQHDPTRAHGMRHEHAMAMMSGMAMEMSDPAGM